MTFKEFLGDRLDTWFGALRPVEYSGQTLEKMTPAYLTLFCDLAKTAPKATKSTRLEWMSDDGGRKCNAVMQEFAGSESGLPSGPEIRSAWARMFPVENVAKQQCGFCGGSGFLQTLPNDYGITGAYPCDHATGYNPRMQVRTTPAVARHYLSEMEDARVRMVKAGKAHLLEMGGFDAEGL